MSTRSRAANGRYIATDATTDPTGGGAEETQEPDLSANTEPEPLADPGAEPDSGDLAGQGGDGAGTDSEPSTESSQDGSGSDDEEECNNKDQPDPAQAYRKAAEDGIRDWLGTVTSKDEMGSVVQALRAAGIHIPGIEEDPSLLRSTSQSSHPNGPKTLRSRAKHDAEKGMCDDADDPSIDAEDDRKTVHGRTASAKETTPVSKREVMQRHHAENDMRYPAPPFVALPQQPKGSATAALPPALAKAVARISRVVRACRTCCDVSCAV